MKHNQHQRERMRKLSKELGVDIYKEKTVGIDYNDPDFQKLAEELIPSEDSFNRYTSNANGSFSLKGEIPNSCSWVNGTAVINSDGTVVPCCYDLYSKHIMGNAFEENLITSIWKNKKYDSFRNLIRTDRKKVKICSICSEGRYQIQKKETVSN